MTPQTFAPARSAPVTSASVRSASVRSAPVRSASVKSAPDRSALRSMAFRITAPLSWAKLIWERVMSARVSVARVRFGLVKSVRQMCSMNPDLLIGAQVESVRSAPEKSEPAKVPKNLAPLSEAALKLGASRRIGFNVENGEGRIMLALSRLAPSRRAPTSVTRSSMAPERFVLERSAPERSAPKKSVLLRLAFLKSKLDKSSRLKFLPSRAGCDPGAVWKSSLEMSRAENSAAWADTAKAMFVSTAQIRRLAVNRVTGRTSAVIRQPPQAVSDQHERLRGEPRFDLYR